MTQHWAKYLHSPFNYCYCYVGLTNDVLNLLTSSATVSFRRNLLHKNSKYA